MNFGVRQPDAAFDDVLQLVAISSRRAGSRRRKRRQVAALQRVGLRTAFALDYIPLLTARPSTLISSR